jgi:hypothetical protein
MEMDFLAEAVELASFEFSTDLATFVIRRPLGKATEKEKELWFDAGFLHAKQYEKTADVRNTHSLEVVAIISADSSKLVLHGASEVRLHNHSEDDWRELGNVDQMDTPLGTCTYIDGDASEKDYSLGKAGTFDWMLTRWSLLLIVPLHFKMMSMIVLSGQERHTVLRLWQRFAD